MQLQAILKSPTVQRGLIAIVAAIGLLAFPELLTRFLALLIGAVALATGLVDVRDGIRQRKLSAIAVGSVFVATGVTLIFLGETARRVVVLLIAGLILVRALRCFASAVAAQRDPEGDPFWPLAQGVLSLTLAVAIVLIPGTVVTTVILSIGVFWILFLVVVVVNAIGKETEADVPKTSWRSSGRTR